MSKIFCQETLSLKKAKFLDKLVLKEVIDQVLSPH